MNKLTTFIFISVIYLLGFGCIESDLSFNNEAGFCTDEYAPVCGVDGNTYSNRCQAEYEGILSYTEGPCKDCVCTDEYAPVCGVDGNTYSNDCEAECAGISSYTEGPCEGCDCTAEIDPVCGEYHKTYSNSCEAECVNVHNFIPGICYDSSNDEKKRYFGEIAEDYIWVYAVSHLQCDGEVFYPTLEDALLTLTEINVEYYGSGIPTGFITCLACTCPGGYFAALIHRDNLEAVQAIWEDSIGS